MVSLQDYSIPIHKSFHQPDLLLGIPKVILVLILLATVGVIYFFGFLYGFIGVVFYVPCRLATNHDANLLENALFSLFEVDYLEG